MSSLDKSDRQTGEAVVNALYNEQFIEADRSNDGNSSSDIINRNNDLQSDSSGIKKLKSRRRSSQVSATAPTKPWRIELRKWGVLSTASGIKSFFQLLPLLVALSIIKLTNVEAISLVQVYVYQFMEIAWRGVSGTLNALISQSHGLSSITAMRGWALMSLIVMLLCNVVLSILCCSAYTVFKASSLSADLSHKASIYALTIIPALFFEGFNVCLSSYLISFQEYKLPAVITFLSAIANIGLSYYFVFHVEYSGSDITATAFTWDISSLINLILISLCAYFILNKELYYGLQDLEGRSLLKLSGWRKIINSLSERLAVSNRESLLDSNTLYVHINEDEDYEDDAYGGFEDSGSGLGSEGNDVNDRYTPPDRLEIEPSALSGPESGSVSAIGGGTSGAAASEEGFSQFYTSLKRLPRQAVFESVDRSGQDWSSRRQSRLSSAARARHRMRTSDDRSVLETGDARDVWEWINRWSRLAIYLRQVIPNFVAVFIENFTYFLMTSFAIQLGDKPIVAHNINMLLLGVLSTITYGMCEATSIRIGYHIGRRDVEAAKTVILIATVGSAVVSWTIAAVMVLFATELTSLFTDDSDISRLSVSIAPIVWPAYALFCTGSQLLAVLKGQGRAREQARLLLVGLWVVTLPLFYLCYSASAFGLAGLWVSILIGYLVTTLAALLLVRNTDWEACLLDARVRLGIVLDD